MIHWLGEPLRGRHPFCWTEPSETEYAAFGITLFATASSLFLYPEAPKQAPVLDAVEVVQLLVVQVLCH